LEKLKVEREALVQDIYANLTPWQRVQVARSPDRPQTLDYLERIFENFMELAGDRAFADDMAIITGFATIGPHRVMLIGQHKGRTIQERAAANCGCPHPEGYRKALRKMKLAEKFGLPVVTIIDTKGAFPGVGAEARGQSIAIAENLLEMSRLKTPIVCVVIGEGGSGGALGVGVGDRMAMMEHAFYSVISPEGCAAILWRTGEKAPEAAEAMKITAKSLKALDVIDDIIPEPLGGAHRSLGEAAGNLERYIVRTLRELKRVPLDHLLQHRYQRWRRMGKVIHLELQAQKP
jgi:acetyl-CoA carboxylase carboxyl transferase subunit alpha